MEAVILAGGFGTRLRPLTYTRAKPLLPILNKPMVTHLIDTLPDEVDKIILAVNYRKDQIEKYFKENDFGKKIIVNDEPTPLGTGGAVKFAEKHITSRFFVLNADVVCSLSLSDMMAFHEKNNSVSTISLWPVENVSEFGVADVKDNGKITKFVEKPRPEDAPSNFINAGAYLLEPEILDYIETKQLISMEKEIFPQIIKNTGRFYGFKFEGHWMDIGRISSYLEVHKFLMEKKGIENLIGKNCNVNGELNGSCIGDYVKIENNAKINSCIVYGGATIEEGANLKNCVVGENCIVHKNSILDYSVLGDKEQVPEGSSISGELVWNQPIPEGYPNKQVGNAIPT
ncbi:MAG: NDP-sugar synthase [Candidatus Thermoplasmatota archaeon]|nr:NDP-sugar synthase [Candidatus Thermoplasmatota archaeon]